MEFNSLDAQREACEAYIASQRSEGWVATRERYDDGGFSGGTLERPGLKQLLADIDDGLIDVVVVYKIDRLSRSLMDFSKLGGRGAGGVAWRQASSARSRTWPRPSVWPNAMSAASCGWHTSRRRCSSG